MSKDLLPYESYVYEVDKLFSQDGMDLLSAASSEFDTPDEFVDSIIARNQRNRCMLYRVIGSAGLVIEEVSMGGIVDTVDPKARRSKAFKAGGYVAYSEVSLHRFYTDAKTAMAQSAETVDTYLNSFNRNPVVLNLASARIEDLARVGHMNTVRTYGGFVQDFAERLCSENPGEYAGHTVEFVQGFYFVMGAAARARQYFVDQAVRSIHGFDWSNAPDNFILHKPQPKPDNPDSPDPQDESA